MSQQQSNSNGLIMMGLIIAVAILGGMAYFNDNGRGRHDQRDDGRYRHDRYEYDRRDDRRRDERDRYRRDRDREHGDDYVIDPFNDRDEKRRDDRKPEPGPDRVDLSKTKLVTVFDSETGKKPVWMAKLLDDAAFWHDWLRKHSIDRFNLDPSKTTDGRSPAESFIAAAKKRGCEVPFVAHIGPGGRVLSITQLRNGITTEDIKTVILEVAK